MPKQISSALVRTLALGSLMALAPAFASPAIYAGLDDPFDSMPMPPLRLASLDEELSRPVLAEDSSRNGYAFGSITLGLYGISFVGHFPAANAHLPGATGVRISNALALVGGSAGAGSGGAYGLIQIASGIGGAAVTADADAPELATLIMIGTGLALMRFLTKATQRPAQ